MLQLVNLAGFLWIALLVFGCVRFWQNGRQIDALMLKLGVVMALLFAIGDAYYGRQLLLFADGVIAGLLGGLVYLEARLTRARGVIIGLIVRDEDDGEKLG